MDRQSTGARLGDLVGLRRGLRGRQGSLKEEGQQEREKRGGNGAHGRSLQRDRSPLRNHFPGATMSDCSWKISRCAAVRPAVTGQRLARAPCAWWISGSMAIRLHGHGASNRRFPWIKKRPSALSYADGECQAG